jgi:hypothetical protein
MDTPDTSIAAAASVTSATGHLLALGFSAPEAERLLALRRRWPLGDGGDLTRPGLNEKRLRFARWLVQHGRLGEHGASPDPPTHERKQDTKEARRP